MEHGPTGTPKKEHTKRYDNCVLAATLQQIIERELTGDKAIKLVEDEPIRLCPRCREIRSEFVNKLQSMVDS